MKTAWLIFSSLFLQLIHLFAQHGVTPGWQSTVVPLPKVNPTYAAYTTVGSAVVVDKSGKIYVFYKEMDLNNPTTERIYINTSSDGINWTPNIFPPAQNDKPGYYNVAIDTANNIHVVWVKNSTGQLYYSKYDCNLSQWVITNTIISNTVNESIRGTSITVDRKMRVHVSWIDGQNDNSVNGEIMYRRSPDNGTTWDAQQNISNTPGYPSCWQRSDFSGTFSDTLVYVWRESVNPSGTNWDIMLAYSTNGGVSWQTRICSTASGHGQQRDPVSAVLKDNSIIIAYEDWPTNGYKKIYAGKSSNIVTTDPSFSQISDTVQSELLIHGYDYKNNLYYAFWKWRYAAEAPNHMDIGGRFFDNNTQSWSNTNPSGGGVEWCTDIGSQSLGFKKCAIGPDGKVHLFYETPPGGISSIYYTYRSFPLTGISSSYLPPDNNLIIYPNPFSTQTILQTHKQLADATLTITNIFGQTVEQIKNIYGQRITFSRGNLPCGLYFIRLTEENKTIAVDRLLIEN
ncbi:MAG: hypothetical protein KatS3mg027_1368 [Bacteroidia bacterium]|nr:MAG: hypothetical protein KatS3mg027_1368 [Bacteroidia bacterium]